MDDTARFCASCGKGRVGLAVDSQLPREKLSSHLKIMGILWVVYSAFRILAGFGILAFSHFFLPLISNYLPRDADSAAMLPGLIQLLSTIYAVAFFISLAAGAVGVSAAIGLLQRRPWGRILALVAAFVSVLSIPLGTALAVYTMIILFSSGNDENYRRLAVAA